ncbi:MAG: 4-hydroxy-tetrahydrodipicolinate reductase [Candidatus Diapherotrites archaeon]|nr:4-hydroxy-tetrahydrodipicolinate reductase [Candidatus Diapherotrites archaeon]
MNIAIVGFGKMGQLIGQKAEELGINVVSTIDPSAKGAKFTEISAESVKGADACIDFSVPQAALQNITKLASLRKNIVMGTTGWYEHTAEAKKIVEQSGIGMVYAGNFSLGVNAFYRILEKACNTMDGLGEYDVFAYEIHHNRKKDSPSGTAEEIGRIISKNIARKTRIATERLDRKIEPDELHLASVRGGFVPGTHTVVFDSAFDSIELSHIARTREGFAFGALKAAQWIRGKKGFYHISDWMKETLK